MRTYSNSDVPMAMMRCAWLGYRNNGFPAPFGPPISRFYFTLLQNDSHLINASPYYCYLFCEPTALLNAEPNKLNAARQKFVLTDDSDAMRRHGHESGLMSSRPRVSTTLAQAKSMWADSAWAGERPLFDNSEMGDTRQVR
jgi:hypothetical protein